MKITGQNPAGEHGYELDGKFYTKHEANELLAGHKVARRQSYFRLPVRVNSIERGPARVSEVGYANNLMRRRYPDMDEAPKRDTRDPAHGASRFSPVQ